MITHVFVYGTLKQGQCRSGLWPFQPQLIQPAWTRGRLLGRSDYPAMVAGDDRVLGEVWRYREDQIGEVMRVLDQIEGTDQPGQPDLYIRTAVQTFHPLDDAPIAIANAYHYGTDPIADGFRRIVPTAPENWVQWP